MPRASAYKRKRHTVNSKELEALDNCLPRTAAGRRGCAHCDECDEEEPNRPVAMSDEKFSRWLLKQNHGTLGYRWTSVREGQLVGVFGEEGADASESDD